MFCRHCFYYLRTSLGISELQFSGHINLLCRYNLSVTITSLTHREVVSELFIFCNLFLNFCIFGCTVSTED